MLQEGVSSPHRHFHTSFTKRVQERRRDLRRRQELDQYEDGIELDGLPHTLTHAISHAFTRPDVAFLTNNGALPNPMGEEDENVQSPNPSTLSKVSQGPYDEYLVSGALGISPDLEAQA